METETTLEDCQSYDINDPGLLSCAAKIDPAVYEEYTDLPVLIQRDVLPERAKTLLSECDGDSNCKLIAYDFQTNTGQKTSSAEYMISLENTDTLNRGVFIKGGSTQPIVAIEPPGYTYSYIPVNPLHSSVTKILSPVPTANDQKSSEMCARFCDTVPSCVAFNYSLLNSTCQFFSHYGDDAFSYGEASFTDVSYIKDDVTSAAGKKQPSLMYANTYLEHSGNECTSMPLCNSNLQALVNTGTAVGFSTDDLLACSYCPVKTFKSTNNSFFVQDEVGQTRQFSSKDLAIQNLLFKNTINPNNIVKKDDGVTRGTRDSMMYTVQAYDTSIPFKKQILFVSESDTAYSLYEIDLKPVYTCHPDISPYDTINYTNRSNGVNVAGYIDSAGVFQQLQTGTYNKRDYRDNLELHYTTNPGWLRDQKVPVTTISVQSGFSSFPSNEDHYHRLNGTKCYNTATATTTGGCIYECSTGYSGDSFTEGEIQNCDDAASKICSKNASLVPLKTPVQLYSLTNNLFRVSESSNTFQVEDIDYVSDGFRLKHNQTFKYVSARQKMISRGDKYSSEYNESIFVLSNPVSILDYLKATFPSSNFLFQRRDGVRYTYDRTNLKILQNVFSIFPLTFNDSCADGVSYTDSTVNSHTLCDTPPGTPPIQPPTAIQADDYLPFIINRSSCTETKWIVIDIPLGFDFTTATPDTTNIFTIPSTPNDYTALYTLTGINNSLLFPIDSYSDESLTTYSFTFSSIPSGGSFSDGTVIISQDSAAGTGTAVTRGGMVTTISNFTVTSGTFKSGYVTITPSGGSTPTQTALIASILNLRKWIQSQLIYKPFFTPSQIYIPGFLADTENNRNYAVFYSNHADCIKTKLDEAVTRLSPLTITDNWSTRTNLVLTYKIALSNNHLDAINAFRDFFTTTNFLSKVDIIIEKNERSLVEIRACRRRFAELCKNTINHYLTSIIPEVIRQTNQYIVEAYGINEDDLRVISNLGSGGATSETVPIITLYNGIRQNKAYVDDDRNKLSSSIVAALDYLASDNWPVVSSDIPQSPPGWYGSYGINPVAVDAIQVLSLLENSDTAVMPGIISYIVFLHQMYEDSYQKLVRIKGLAGPGDVPKIEDTLVQQKMASVQKSLNDTVLYKLPTFLDSPNFTQAMTNTIDKATFNYEQVTLADGISTQLPFQKIIDKATFNYEQVSSAGSITQLPFQTMIDRLTFNYGQVSSADSITQLPFQKIIDRLTFNQICLSGTSSSTTLEPCTPCPPGKYASSIGSTACMSCSAGTYAAVEGSTSCAPWSEDCVAGYFVSTQPTDKQNRICTSCSVGYFSSINNAAQCTSCVSGSTSTINKTGCTCTTSIPNGYYDWEVTNVCSKKCNPGYSLVNGSCTLSDCVLAGGKAFNSTSGSWTCDTTTGKYYRTDQISQDATPPCTRPNNPMYSTVNGVSYGTTDSYSSTSVTYTTTTGGLCCPSGTYYNSATGSCTTCSTCAAAPTNATLTQGVCSGSTDRTCSYACNSGFSSSGSGSTISCTCGTGKYINASRACVSCSTCSPAPSNATLTQGGCSGSTDRTCSYACNSGFSSSGSGSTISCTCGTGKYINASRACVSCSTCSPAPSNATLTQGGCSGSTDRTCSYACNSGFIDVVGSGLSSGLGLGSATGMPTCVCSSGKYINASGACVTCQTCSPAPTYGILTETGCSGSTDRTCSYTCNAGFNLLGTGSTRECRCIRGKFIDSDIFCKDCASGTFTDQINSTSCARWSVCQRGTYISTTANKTRDRVCTECTDGTFTNQTNLTSCASWSVCPPGTRITIGGSKVSDRICAACPSGTYTAQSNLRSCTTCGSCPANQVRINCLSGPGTCYCARPPC